MGATRRALLTGPAKVRSPPAESPRLARGNDRDGANSAEHVSRKRAAVVGHEDQFRPPGLGGRCRVGEPTFAGSGGKEEDAPIPDLRGVAIEPRGSALS
jgi:hypothetical protein